MRNFLVLHKPESRSDSTVDKIKVIDAWSASYGLKDARIEAVKKSDEYLNKFGSGRIQVVEANSKEFYVIK